MFKLGGMGDGPHESKLTVTRVSGGPAFQKLNLETKRAGERLVKDAGGPVVWLAYVFGHSPHDDEVGYWWAVWDESGASRLYNTKRRTSRAREPVKAIEIDASQLDDPRY